MRGGLEARLTRAWREGAAGWGLALALVTTPLSWLWRGATAARNRYRDRVGGGVVEGVRVISVGNLAVGGTGKTPLTGWLVDRVAELGARPAIVLRGYGEDEVLLHRRWRPAVPVVADPDRIAAVTRARDEGASVVVVDDGFQHRRLARDLDLVLLAVEDRFPGHVLPRGLYREPPEALARAHAIVLTRRTAGVAEARARADAVTPFAPEAVVASAHLRPGRWLDATGRPASPPPGPVLAVAGIARPDTFLAAARAALPGTDVRLRAFADHHEYSEADVRRLVTEARERTLVTTEKDAVKLTRLESTPASLRVLASEVAWDWGEDDLLQGLEVVLAGARA